MQNDILLHIQEIIKNKPYLAWYVKDPTSLSIESAVEHILNYGSWTDFQALLKILGKEKTAQIFVETNKKPRSNYRPAIAHYFKLFFANYA